MNEYGNGCHEVLLLLDLKLIFYIKCVTMSLINAPIIGYNG